MADKSYKIKLDPLVSPSSMTEYRTSCCNAPYGVGGEGITHWYLCTACGQPTHVLGDEEPTEAEMEALLLRSEHAVG